MTGSHRHRDDPHRSRQDPGTSSRRLAATLALVVVYMLAEVVGGLLSGSLALLADAAHMLSDAGALALSLAAIRMAARPRDLRRTYGYQRAEVLAALIQGVVLLGISLSITVEAVGRLLEPADVAGRTVLLVAAGGLAVNLAGLWILHGSAEGSLNVRGARLHVLADTLGSVQVILAGLLIWLLGWTWADAVASMLVAGLLVFSGWKLLREVVNVLMEGAPEGLDLEQVEEALLELEGVELVHDLHVWSISSGFVALSAHLVAPEPRARDLLDRARDVLESRFGIGHATLQLEHSGEGRPDEREGVGR